MVFLVTSKFTLQLRTQRTPCSPALSALLPIGGCHLAYAMPQAHSNGACLAFLLIFLKIVLTCLWMTLQCMDPLLMHVLKV